jgi:tetratricopeptide (TPR) repeat protein
MKWKTIAEVRVLWILAALVVLIFAVPYSWNHFAGEKAMDVAAAEDQRKILSDLASGRVDQAWIVARLYLRNDHAEGPSLKEVGSAFLEAGLPDEAFLSLETAYRKDGDPSTLLLMAEASLQRGNTLDAVTFADLAVSTGAGGRTGLLVLGRCLAADGRYADAVMSFSAVLDRWPADPDALRGKASSFQAIGRFAQSYDLWTNYLKRFEVPVPDADKAEVLDATVQRVLCLEGQSLEVDARAAWNSLLSDGAAQDDAAKRKAGLEGLADHELSNGNPDAAEALYRELIATQGDTATAGATIRLRLALCLQLQGKDDEAAVVVSRLLVSSPEAAVPLFMEERFEPLRIYTTPSV